jgi:hypothetical protein
MHEININIAIIGIYHLLRPNEFDNYFKFANQFVQLHPYMVGRICKPAEGQKVMRWIPIFTYTNQPSS